MYSPDKLEKKGFDFLKKLYELSGGTDIKFLNVWEIGEQLCLDRELTISITRYLEGEALIQFKAIGGIISITHHGIKKVEKSLQSEQQQHKSDPQSIMRKRSSKLNQDVQIFISYAKEDSEKAIKLYNELNSQEGLKPWIDKKSLLGRQKWKIAIGKAIRESRFFIALLSSNSVNKMATDRKNLKKH